MPEDIEAGQVSEQVDATDSQDDSVIETEYDEADAFNDDSDDDGFDEVDLGKDDDDLEDDAGTDKDSEDDDGAVTDDDESWDDAGTEAGDQKEDQASDEVRKRAEERADRRYREIKEKGYGDQAAQGDQKKTGEDSALTKERISDYLNSVSLDEIPKGEIIIGNKSVNLHEMADIDPDQFNAVLVLSSIVAEKKIDEIISSHFPDITKEIDTLKTSNDQLRFEIGVSRVHPDWENVVGSSEWSEWFSKQTPQMQSLSSSIDVKDGVELINCFKNEVKKEEQEAKKEAVKEKAQGIDSKRKKSKANFDSVHKSTVRKKSAKVQSAMSPEEEEMEAFNEDDDDDDTMYL